MNAHHHLPFEIAPQPDEITCGPACLYSIYRYYGHACDLTQVIAGVEPLPGGGTLAVHLGLHAIAHGFQCKIYTCNLQLFDPSWFANPGISIADKLRQQMKVKRSRKLHLASRAYIAYDEAGGQLHMCDFSVELLTRLLADGTPIIAGLNATWLYGSQRDRQDDMVPDDIAGESTGHFVVIHGIDGVTGQVSICDPYLHTPYPGSRRYTMDVNHVIHAILLGIVTYDAKLLVISRPDQVNS